MKKINYNKLKISIIGLGYVGLPLALRFSKFRELVGFDLDSNRINSLRKGIDQNSEFSKKEILKSKKILFSNNKIDIKNSNCYI